MNVVPRIWFNDVDRVPRYGHGMTSARNFKNTLVRDRFPSAESIRFFCFAGVSCRSRTVPTDFEVSMDANCLHFYAGGGRLSGRFDTARAHPLCGSLRFFPFLFIFDQACVCDTWGDTREATQSFFMTCFRGVFLGFNEQHPTVLSNGDQCRMK